MSVTHQQSSTFRIALLALAVSAGTISQLAAANTSSSPLSASIAARCQALTNVSLTNAKVTSAQIISGHYTPQSELADNLRGAKSAPIDNLPETCRVTITVEPQINVELWLPTKTWNNRFQAVGGGGYAGFIAYDTLALAVKAGFASASTDTGHTGSPREGSFAAKDGKPQADLITDFAHRSVHEMALKSKEVISAFYKSAPNYSYWNGCSTGGRQGLMEAQRYPQDFDGILAGAPAINWDRFIPAELWPQVVMQEELGGPISDEKLAAVKSEVIKAFDQADGVKDGVVRDPSQITVGDQILKAAGLTDQEMKTVRKIWAGPQDEHGSSLWYGLQPSAPLSALAGNSPFPIPVDFLKYWVNTDGKADWKSFGYKGFRDYFAASGKKFRPVLGTDNPNLSEFKNAGGKLIIWHGWNDQLIFPEGSIDYYTAMIQAMGGSANTESFARLYMAPGVEHCRGGEGPDSINGMEALVSWVEKGKAPDHLTATKAKEGKVIMKRPLCAYPQQAIYNGSGDTNQEENFSCGLVNDKAS